MIGFEFGKELASVTVLLCGGAIQSDHDAVDEIDLVELVDDIGKRVAFEFGKQRGQDEGDLA